MGMSTHVVGIVPPDDEWRKMKAVYDTCTAAGVEVPAEVSKFFNDEPPDPAGVVVDLRDGVRTYRSEYQDGYEIEVGKIPAHVKIIRVYNSY